MREGVEERTMLARVSLAGFMTGAAFLREWTEVTSRYGVEVGKTLIGLRQNRRGYGEAAAAVMEEYLKYLRQVANLPRIYGLRFYSELERIRRGRDD